MDNEASRIVLISLDASLEAALRKDAVGGGASGSLVLAITVAFLDTILTASYERKHQVILILEFSQTKTHLFAVDIINGQLHFPHASGAESLCERIYTQEFSTGS